MLGRSISAATIAALIVTASLAQGNAASPARHTVEPAHAAAVPGRAAARGFARTALHYLTGPAQRPFLNLLKTLPLQGDDVEISKAKTQNMNCDPASNTCVPTAPNAVLNVKDLVTLLRGGSWSIVTSADAPDIVVDDGFAWTSQNGLTLQAIGNVTINAPVQDFGVAPLAINYNVNGTGGALSFGSKGNISFLGLSNSLTINGQSYVLAPDVQTLAQLVQRDPSGNFALAGSYDAKKDGPYAGSPIQTVLQGNFEGLGNTISNLHVESAQQSQGAGLFHEIAQTANLENLNLKSTKMEINGVTVVGGLVDLNHGTMFSNSSDADIGLVINGSNGCAIGGLAGASDGAITYSHASGAISVTYNGGNADNPCYAGGLVGASSGVNGTIQFSYAIGSVVVSVQAPAAALIGGLSGDFESAFSGTIDHTFAIGTVSLTGYGDAGGLVGYHASTGSVLNSSASGSATANGDSEYVGGLIGATSATGNVDLTVATGAVAGSGEFVFAGGAVGWARTSVNDSFSFGTVTAGPVIYYIGGFVGLVVEGTSFSNDQWDMKTSKINDPGAGAGNIRYYPGITGFN